MEYVLQHHGVKGQRWGIRKKRYSISKYLKKRKRTKTNTIVKKGDLDYIKKHPEKFTNKQISDAIARKQTLNSMNTSKVADKINSFNNKLKGEGGQKKEKKSLDQKLQTASNVLNVVSKAFETYNKATPFIKAQKQKKVNSFLEEANEAVKSQNKEWIDSNMLELPASVLNDYVAKANAMQSYEGLVRPK